MQKLLKLGYSKYLENSAPGSVLRDATPTLIGVFARPEWSIEILGISKRSFTHFLVLCCICANIHICSVYAVQLSHPHLLDMKIREHSKLY